MRRLAAWVNSVQAHMLALPLVAIAGITAMSLLFLDLTRAPQRSSIPVRELARHVRGLPTARMPLELDEALKRTVAPQSTDRGDLIIRDLLAHRLGVAPDEVRVQLNQGDRDRAPMFAREVELYRHDGGADPLIYGSFEVAVRDAAGWHIFSRKARDPVSIWHRPARLTVLLGILLVIPLSLWFSARLTRPIRTFSASIRRLGPQDQSRLVPVAGPTELRLAASSINEMQARIARYVRERSSLVAAIAHDLRTPLARLEFHMAGAEPDLRRAAGREIREMERLIETTLDFVDTEHRQRHLELVELETLVAGLVDDFADTGRDVHLTALTEESLPIHGDVVLLKRLFGNLIENAIKYGTTASVEVLREGTRARVRVTDRGPGMTVEEIDRAFEPFYRGEPSRNRDTGGTGLGLSIVRMAVDAHDGEIEIANASPHGLSVTVTLDLAEGR